MRRVGKLLANNGRLYESDELDDIWVCLDFDDLPPSILRFLALYRPENVEVEA